MWHHLQRVVENRVSLQQPDWAFKAASCGRKVETVWRMTNHTQWQGGRPWWIQTVYLKLRKRWRNITFPIAQTSIFITDVFHSFPGKRRFCSLKHMVWKQCFILTFYEFFQFCARVKYATLDGNIYWHCLPLPNTHLEELLAGQSLRCDQKSLVVAGHPGSSQVLIGQLDIFSMVL